MWFFNVGFCNYNIVFYWYWEDNGKVGGMFNYLKWISFIRCIDIKVFSNDMMIDSISLIDEFEREWNWKSNFLSKY